MKDTLIISNGPAQLISQLCILREKGLDHRLIGVARMMSKLELKGLNPKTLESEKWILKTLGIGFLGTINRPYQIWGETPKQKLSNLIRFKKNIKNHLIENTPEINLLTVKNILISYRPENGDSFFYKAFKNLKNIYFNPDGSIDYFSTKNELKMPFFFKLLQLPNIYKNKPSVYFLKELKPQKTYNITEKIISNEVYKTILNQISSAPDFKRWIENSGVKSLTNTSLLFLQSFFADAWQGINMVEFYLALIKNELCTNQNQILVKFHPREAEYNIQEVILKVGEQFNDKVKFFDNTLYSFLPIEFIANKLIINRVITISSTAIYYFKSNPTVETVLYSCQSFNTYEKEKVELSATFLGTQVNYI